MTSAENRLQLFEKLSKLPLPDFEELLFRLKPPAGIVPPPVAPQRSRVAALLEWAESIMDYGAEEVENCLNKLLEVENPKGLGKFKEYIDLVCEDYQGHWKHYAFIDEIDESTWFEFGLDTEFEYKQKLENESQPEDESQSDSNARQAKREPILEVIQKLGNQSLLIFGSSGSGKSTLLAKLFYKAALKAQKGESDLIPVLIELKSYGTALEGGGIEDLILSFLQNYDSDLDKEDLKQIRKQRRLVLFIDGFNELSNEKAKPKIKQYCRNILTIATSRNEGDWRELGQKLEIKPLTHNEVIDFFRKRLPRASQSELEKLGNRVRDFGDTPLMVWMLYCIFNANNKEIPETRGEAYRRFTTLYLESKTEDDLLESRNLLGKLAFEMMQSTNIKNPANFRLEIPEFDAQNLLGSVRMAELLRNRHLLKSYGEPGNRWIKFCHQSLQEYYAAEELLMRLRKGDIDVNDDQRFKYFYLNYLKWTETISLMMSLLDDQDKDFICQIIRLALEVDLLLGAKLAGSIKFDLQHEVVEFLLSPKICRYVRIGFLKFIVRLDSPFWLKIILWKETRSAIFSDKWLELVNSECSWSRWHAVYSLRYCEPNSVTSAFQKALEDVDQDVRLVGVRSLAHFNSEASLPCLIKATTDENASIRDQAVRAISELRTKDAIPIFRSMVNDESGYVRHNVLQGLSMLDPETAISELIPLIKNRRLYPAIAGFLGKIGTKEAFEGLIKVLEHEDAVVRKYAIDEIGKFDQEMAISQLASVLKNDKDHSVREKAINTIGKFTSTKVFPILVETLNDQHYSVCLPAAVLLIEVEPEKSMSIIRQALENRDPAIRHSAVLALDKLGSRSSDALHKMLEDEDIFIRREAALELVSQGINSGITEIISMLDVDSLDTYYSLSRKVLNKLNFEDLASDLREFIEGRNIDVNSRLISDFLVNKIPELLTLLDSEETLRQDAKYLLAKIPPQKKTLGFLKAMICPDENVRFRAENVLKQINVNDIFSVLYESYFTSEENGSILCSLMEIFPTNFHDFFFNANEKKVFQSLGQENTKYFDVTRPFFPPFLGKKILLSSKTIRILMKVIKKDDIDSILRAIQLCSIAIPEQSVPILLKLLNSKHPIVRQTAEEQLEFLDSDNFLPELLKMIASGNESKRNWAIRLLSQSQNTEASKAMPLLVDKLRSSSGSVALRAIKAIQASCQMYNYDIAKLKLEPIDCRSLEMNNQIINVQMIDKFYSQKLDNLSSQKIGILNNGNVNIQGDQKGFD